MYSLTGIYHSDTSFKFKYIICSFGSTSITAWVYFTHTHNLSNCCLRYHSFHPHTQYSHSRLIRKKCCIWLHLQKFQYCLQFFAIYFINKLFQILYLFISACKWFFDLIKVSYISSFQSRDRDFFCLCDGLVVSQPVKQWEASNASRMSFFLYLVLWSYHGHLWKLQQGLSTSIRVRLNFFKCCFENFCH